MNPLLIIKFYDILYNCVANADNLQKCITNRVSNESINNKLYAAQYLH